MRLRFAAGLIGTACAMTFGTAAHAQFYSGKSITMIINYGAGGNTDIEGRVFARHLPDHLAGKPNFVVLDKPGAGGLVGINYLGSGAVRADGLTFGFFTFNAVAPIVHDPGLKVKISDFPFIAGVSQYQAAYGRKDMAPGMAKPSDIVKAKLVYAAGYNPSTPQDTRLKITLDLIGAKYKMVTGFRSIGDINKAMMQKEISFTASSMPAYQSQTLTNLIKPGIAMPFWYYQVQDINGNFKKYPLLENEGVRGYVDVYKEVHGGKMPSGPKWDAFVILNDIATSMLRFIVMPHGAPKAAVEEMRKAFAELENDRAFQDDYERLIKVKAQIVSAEEGEHILKRLDHVSPAAVQALKQVVSGK